MKYLELIKGQFTADHEARAKQEEPYVAYSEEADGVMYNFIPAPVVGPANNEIWYTSSDGNVVTPNYTDVFGANIVSNTYENGKGVITFDGEVTSIGDFAFADCSGLTSITIPNSVMSIGERALEGCSGLTSITIPNSVTRIGERAFNGCSGLTSITIPNSITNIGYRVFNYCSGLTSITIPNSVTSIGYGAFWYCSGLNYITYEGTQEQWNSITKGSDWNYNVPATYVQCTDGQVAL